MTSATPGSSRPEAKATSPAPSPPAAPAPGWSRIGQAQVARDDSRKVVKVAVEFSDHRGVRALSAARRQRRRRAGRRGGCPRRRRRPPRRRRASGRALWRQSMPGGRGRRRPARSRGLGRRAGGSRGPGRAPRRRRWSRCRRYRGPRRCAPDATAARSSSPVPRVEVRDGSRRSRGTSARPDAAAISMTAVWPSPSIPNRAETGSPSGPATTTSENEPPVAATSASTVPSPPSAIGAWSIAAPGTAVATPRAIAFAASGAERLPLNLSGATTTLMSSARLAQECRDVTDTPANIPERRDASNRFGGGEQASE